jgi:hypothetical protein
LLAVKLAYGSAPVTTTVTITEAENLEQTLLSVTGNTDGIFYPRVATDKSTDGTATGEYDDARFEGPLDIDVAGANDASTVTVTLMYEHDARIT